MLGVYISFLNPSLLLQSFLCMKNKYISFLNFVHFFLFWKLVHYLLKICTFLSLFIKNYLFKYSTLPSYNSKRTTLNLCRFLSYLNFFVHEQEKPFNARLWFRDIDFWLFSWYWSNTWEKSWQLRHLIQDVIILSIISEINLMVSQILHK